MINIALPTFVVSVLFRVLVDALVGGGVFFVSLCFLLASGTSSLGDVLTLLIWRPMRRVS